jgi:hypothetical protein
LNSHFSMKTILALLLFSSSAFAYQDGRSDALFSVNYLCSEEGPTLARLKDLVTQARLKLTCPADHIGVGTVAFDKKLRNDVLSSLKGVQNIAVEDAVLLEGARLAVLTGHIILKFQPTATMAQAEAALSKFGLGIQSLMSSSSPAGILAYRKRLGQGGSDLEISAELGSLPEVKYAEPDLYGDIADPGL